MRNMTHARHFFRQFFPPFEQLTPGSDSVLRQSCRGLAEFLCPVVLLAKQAVCLNAG